LKLKVYRELVEEEQYSNIDSAYVHALEYIELAKANFEYEERSLAYNILGGVLSDIGYYDPSIEAYLQFIKYVDSVEYKEPSEGELEKARGYHNIALIYSEIRDTVKSLQYYHNSLAVFSKYMTDSFDITPSMHSLGYHHKYSGYPDSAVYYLSIGLGLWEKFQPDNYDGIALIEMELIQALCLVGKVDEAEIRLRRYFNDQRFDELSGYSLAYLDFNEALILSYRGNYESSLKLFQECLHAVDEMGFIESEEASVILREMIRVSRDMKSYENAFKYQSELIRREKLHLDQLKLQRAQVNEIQFRIKDKNDIIQTQTQALYKSEKTIAVISSLSILTLLLGIISFRQFKRERKNATILEEKNERIEILMRELHHRVKNNLQVISSLLSLQSMKVDDMEIKNAIEQGKSRVQAMSLIHQKLYSGDEVSKIDIRSYVKELIDELQSSYGLDDLKVDLVVDELFMDVDTTLPIGLIINELVTNAFKYAYQNIDEPVLKLSLQKNQGEIQLEIKDNGTNEQVVEETSQQSFGLRLVEILVEQLNGKVDKYFNKGLGYKINFNYSR
jgi:two-component sensor histidine kinase